MHTYRVHWRRAESVYASVRTTTVTVDSIDEIPAAVALQGHDHEARPLRVEDIHVLGFLRVLDVDSKVAGGRAPKDVAPDVLAPWERLAYVPNESYRTSWDGKTVRLFAKLVYPSSAWCVTCDCDASDAVAPWAVGHVTRDGYSRTYCRNVQTHANAHRIGEHLVATGSRSFDVFPDRCG